MGEGAAQVVTLMAFRDIEYGQAFSIGNWSAWPSSARSSGSSRLKGSSSS